MIGDGIRIVASEFRIIFENTAHRRLLGDHEGEYCYRAYQQRDSVCDGCPVITSFTDNAVHRSLRSIITAQGARFVEITASCLRDAGGKALAGIEVIRDVTERKQWEDERERLLGELQAAAAQIKTLGKLIPVCAWCGKARDDKGYWEDLEDYIRNHSGVDFTHGICPACLASADPELFGDIPGQLNSEGHNPASPA
jgi:hypothetical protein